MSGRLTREQSRAQTRARLLDAAAELFAENGVNGASVEQIAERAGYSRGALYGNFADKHELTMALLEQRTRREYDEVRALAAGAGSPEEAQEALRAWHRERARHLDGWLALRTELWLYAVRQPQARSAVADGERFARDAIATGLRREFDAAGVTPPADVDRLALIVHALGDGLLMQRALTPREIPEEVAADAVALLLRALVALAREGERAGAGA